MVLLIHLNKSKNLMQQTPEQRLRLIHQEYLALEQTQLILVSLKDTRKKLLEQCENLSIQKDTSMTITAKLIESRTIRVMVENIENVENFIKLPIN